MYSILIMLIGATVFGYVVGSTASGRGLVGSQSARERAKMRALRDYMEEQNMPQSLKRNVREYMRHVYAR